VAQRTAIRGYPIDGTDEIAVVEERSGRTWTYGELVRDVERHAERLRSVARSLAFCRCRIDAATIVNYLAALAAGHPVALLDDGMQPDRLAELEARYLPGLVLHPDGSVEQRRTVGGHELHPDLALMLATSGSTGSPKLVRLTLSNLVANATSIRAYLEIGPDERAIASLPFHYSYGLSVLNSHLLAGASIVLPAEGLVRPSFWDAFEHFRCTSFAGVPYSYAIIERAGWRRRELPTLRTMTQAGGRLEPDATLSLDGELRRRDARLVVMYGQTEATARIAYVPPDRLREKAGAIGIAIPGGRLTVEGDDRREAKPRAEGELVYRGPNVMLGYATGPAELADGDVLGGVLRTGDLGYRDEDGFFFVTRRLARFAKAYGLRVSLDDIEAELVDQGPAAAVAGRGEHIRVFVEARSGRSSHGVGPHLARAFGLPARTFAVTEVQALPTTASGKIDYAALAQLGDG
jgi:acyl-coenzyme A synthetase/AMP-(fatty) acid ligase